MNLGLGLEAANAYFKADDARVLREQQRERYGWDKARNESELRLLPDQEQATRSGYRDTVEANAARARLRPGETDLRVKQNQVANSNADLAIEQLPVTQETTKNTNAAGLSQSKVTAGTAQQAENMLPQTLVQMAGKGAVSAAEQTDAVLGVLARRIRSNDPQGALQFANQVAAIPGLLPNTDGKKFVSITPVQNGTDAAGGTGPGYIFKTDDGQEVFTSHQTMDSAYRRSLGNPKFKFFHDWHTGEVMAGDERTGAVTTARAAVPGRETAVRPPGRVGDGAGKEPADVKKAKWLMDSGVARDEREAWTMVTTAKQKSRAQFIQEYVIKNSGMGAGSNEQLGQDAAKLYDQIRAMDPPAPAAAPSNSATPGTVPGSAISPEMRRLLGIK